MTYKHIDLNKLAKDVKYKREVMEVKGLRELSVELSISASTLSRVENKSVPDLATYCVLCDYLGVSINKYKL